ncbi:WD40 repeat domain-containing protein [Streptomyces albireticuli]|uniref:WD40 repeat domain-containing protein n=1 Tax=Streptomyces albireticuli TaxID=1940 RepID=UPI0036CCFDAC
MPTADRAAARADVPAAEGHGRHAGASAADRCAGEGNGAPPTAPAGDASTGTGCPVCGAAVAEEGGPAACPDCRWPLRADPVLGPLTEELLRAFDDRLATARRRYDLTAAARAAGHPWHGDAALYARLQRLVRNGPPRPGEAAEALRGPWREEAPARTLREAVEAHLREAHPREAAEALAVEITADGLATVGFTRADDGDLYERAETTSWPWTSLLPALPKDPDAARFLLAGGIADRPPPATGATHAPERALTDPRRLDVVLPDALCPGEPSGGRHPGAPRPGGSLPDPLHPGAAPADPPTPGTASAGPPRLGVVLPDALYPGAPPPAVPCPGAPRHDPPCSGVVPREPLYPGAAPTGFPSPGAASADPSPPGAVPPDPPPPGASSPDAPYPASAPAGPPSPGPAPAVLACGLPGWPVPERALAALRRRHPAAVAVRIPPDPARPPRQVLRHAPGLSALACGPGPEPAVTHLAVGCPDGSAAVWAPGAAEPLAARALHTGRVTALDLAPGLRALVTGGSDGAVRLWSFGGSGRSRALAWHEGWVNAVRLRAGAVFSLGDDGLLRRSDPSRLLGAPDGTVYPLKVGWSAATALEVTSDGRILAVGGAAGVELRDAVSGHRLGRLTTGSSVTGLALDADDRLLAVGCADGRVHVHDLRRRTAPDELPGHTGAVRRLTFGPRGLLAACDESGAIRAWPAGRARPGSRGTAVGLHTAAVRGLTVTPAGHLLSASADGLVRAWGLPEPL